jgi:hypothetical protein
MSEKIVRNDELSMRCGSITLRVESLEDFHDMVASLPQHLTLAAEEFTHQHGSLVRSRLDYTHIKNMASTIVSGFVQFEMPANEVWSPTQALNALYEYLTDEALISEERIDEDFQGANTVFSVQGTSGAIMNISYDEEDGDSRMLMHTEVPIHFSEAQLHDAVVDTIRMWGDLHDYAVWVSDEDNVEQVNREIVVKKSVQPAAAYTLWQSLLDYETWRRNLDIADLPTIDHPNIDVGRIGLTLASLERADYELIYPSLQRLGTTLRKYGKTVISDGDLIVALTS